MFKILDLGKNILRSNVSRLPFPYKLTFAVTYWCNYRCKTCNIWERRPKDELSLEDIQRFFRKSPSFNWIDFTGGEVWLRRDFVEIVRSAVTNCPNLYSVHFPTNGFMTDRIVSGVEKIVEMKAPKLTVTVSVDGDEAVNDQVRGIKGGWRHQMDTYKALSKLRGVEVYLGMTLSSLNAEQYDKAFAAAKQEAPWLTHKGFHINVAHESAHYYGNSGMVLIQDKNRIRREVKRYLALRGPSLDPVNWIERRYLKHADKYLETGATPIRCHALRSSCFVNPWGEVYPCGMFDRKIAGLRDHDFDMGAIWNLDKTKQLQQEIWDYQCPQCWTPCEANQSLLGNLLGQHNRRVQARGLPGNAPT
ncbi:MAG: radical SAM protein [Acidobacteriaceae bacterium]|nr:radical SAM protein [Acidobacteriaceae bacterium]